MQSKPYYSLMYFKDRLSIITAFEGTKIKMTTAGLTRSFPQRWALPSWPRVTEHGDSSDATSDGILTGTQRSKTE